MLIPCGRTIAKRIPRQDQQNTATEMMAPKKSWKIFHEAEARLLIPLCDSRSLQCAAAEQSMDRDRFTGLEVFQTKRIRSILEHRVVCSHDGEFAEVCRAAG